MPYSELPRQWKIPRNMDSYNERRQEGRQVGGP